MDADWWKAIDRLDESLKRSHEAARRREEVRQREEAAAAYERHVAEYEQYMAAYERYEAKAAAVAEHEAVAEREAMAAEEQEAAAAVEREAEAERERAAAEAEEDAAEKYEQSATITIFFGSSKAFSFGFLNESSVLPKINAVLPQFNVVLPQFHDLGLEIVFPQISDLRFAVSPKIGNSVLSGGVLGDCGGDSAIDGAGRPPRKPPDSFFCSGQLCFLAADSWQPVLRPPRKPPYIYLYSGNHGFLTGDSCKKVMGKRPPAKPPDSAKDGDRRKGDEGVKGHRPCCCGGGSKERVSILAVTVKGRRPQVSGKMLDPSPIRVGQAQAVQRRSWALLVLGLAGNKKKTKAWRCMSVWV